MRGARRGSGSARFVIEGKPDQDVLFEPCSHPPPRRFVLQYLDAADDVTIVGEVATEPGAWQTEFPVTERTATGIEAIEIALHHRHLPKLAAAGVIEYDSTRGDDHARDPRRRDGPVSRRHRRDVTPADHQRTI